MIIVFSGTGNSMHVARMLSGILGDGIVTLPQPSTALPAPDHDRVIWVMPVYSWGIPPVVARWMKTMDIPGGEHLPHFGVFTCGDDIGNAHFMWGRAADRRNWEPLGEWSVQMPNTYVLMKGFDVDSPTVARKKIESATARTRHIADLIAKMTETFNAGGYCEPVADVVRGRFAWIKTAVIYPWFKRYAMSPEPFFADSRCIGCSICANSCPLKNISMDGGHPRWGKDCALCLRCYHICPRHAVAYSIATRGKGQYTDLIGEVSASKGNAQAD